MNIYERRESRADWNNEYGEYFSTNGTIIFVSHYDYVALKVYHNTMT